MARRSSEEMPADLRARLETARLDLLALFRALDRMHLTPQQIPQRLIRQLFQLDADYVESPVGTRSTPRETQPARHAARYPGSGGATSRCLLPTPPEPPRPGYPYPLPPGTRHPR